MTDRRESLRIISLSFLQPLLSTLSSVLFFSDLYGESFLFSRLYLPVHILLISGSIALFRPYCLKNIYEFEDLGTSLNERIMFVLGAVAAASSLAVSRLNPYMLITAAPFYAAMILTYLISVFHSFYRKRDSEIISFFYFHIRKTTAFTFFLMTVKLFFYLFLLFTDYPDPRPLVSAAGFAADAALIVFLRSRLGFLELGKESFRGRKKPAVSSGSAPLLLALISMVSWVAGGNRSLLGPDTLRRFYLWLSSLSVHLPNREGEISMDSTGSGPTAGELEGMHQYIEARKLDLQFIRRIFEFLQIALFVFLAGFIIYVVFYPLISPFIFRKREPVTFRDYYREIARAIGRFLRNLAGIITVFRRSGNKSDHSMSADKESGRGFGMAKRDPGEAKRAEIKTVSRIYAKLRRKSAVLLENRINPSLGVEDFFGLLSQADPRFQSASRCLAPLFNRSFFSARPLGKEDWHNLKKESSRLLKTL